MAQTTGRDVSYDRFLTDLSIGYKNDSYIIDELVPTITSTKQSGIVPKYNQSNWFRNQAALRAPGTPVSTIGFSTDVTDTYFCPETAIGFEIPDQIRDQADAPFDLDRDGSMFVADKIIMKREIDFASNYFTTSVWGADKTGGTGGSGDFTQWSDYGNSSPLSDISNYADTVEGSIAKEPNILAMGKQAWVKVKWHPDVIDTIKYTQRGQMNTQLFAALVEMDKVLIGRGIYTTSPEGTAEASVSYTRIWGKHALMMYQPASPSLMTPAACYNFTWNRVPSSKLYIRRLRIEEREVDKIQAHSYFTHKVTSSRSGIFLSSVVA